LPYLGIHDNDPVTGVRTWKSFDWDAMKRLRENGRISNPVSKAKLVILTESGSRPAEEAFDHIFGADH